MRFPQLPIGQRFRYQGKVFSKTGPLTASEEGTGNSRLIMKSAEVTLLDLAASALEAKQQFTRQEVEALCARFQAELHGIINDYAGPQTSLAIRDVLKLIEKHTFSID